MTKKKAPKKLARAAATPLTNETAERLIAAHLSARGALSDLRYQAQREYGVLAKALTSNTGALVEFTRRADFLEGMIRAYAETQAADHRRIAFLSERNRQLEERASAHGAEIERFKNGMALALDGEEEEALALCPELKIPEDPDDSK